MGVTTGIAWTDSTINFWIGCTKVGPGCDHCYAENLSTTRLGVGWGPGAPRRRTSPQTWNNPHRWNRARAEGRTQTKGGKPVPLWVFASSLCDFFDNEVDPAMRAEAWAVIRDTPHLRYQIVTKRVSNVPKMLPADWADGSAYAHVGIVATVVTQPEADRDIPRLAALKKLGVRWVGLSIEPQVERIDLFRAVGISPDSGASHAGRVLAEAVDWVIIGGESIQRGQCRPFHIEWARLLIGQCDVAGAPAFMKQLGSAAHLGGNPWIYRDRAGADPDEWPEDIRVREMPRVYATPSAQREGADANGPGAGGGR